MVRSKTIISVAICALVLCSNSFGYSEGTGEPNNPYHIASKADLLQLAATPADYNACFIMTADIDLVGETFTTAVIAPDTDTSTADFQGTMFSGVFDANGHTISNLTISAGATGNDCLGLFGCTSETALVKRLAVTNVAITGTGGSDVCGGIAGMNKGNIQYCNTSGTINAGSVLGGMVGRNNIGSVTRCYSTASVTGTGQGLGGLVGPNTAGANITESYAIGTVSGNVTNVGGLASASMGTISRCYATGNVTGNYAGGLVGNCGGTVTDSYARGNVTVSSTERVGGLLGYQSGGSVSACYSTGYITGSTNSGGLIGYSAAGTTTGSFWDTTTSGKSSSAGGTGKTTAQMNTVSTFTGAGWDFTGEAANGTNDYWQMLAASYPLLFFQPIDSGTIAAPVFSPGGGTYDTEQTVVVTCATAGATIHYTTNGVDPTESDPVITTGASVLMDHSLTLKAKAWKSGFVDSAVSSASYALQVATPVFSPGGGTYSVDQNVVITCVTAGATIHYTTNGADPTESDPVIASGGSLVVDVDPATTLKAKAWKAGIEPSAVQSAQYVTTPLEIIIGTGTSTWYYPFFGWPTSRTEMVYGSSEMPGVCTINALSLYITTAPSQTVGNFTIRMKHTDNYSAGSWETSGWTTVYRANTTISTTGWYTFVLSTPFQYNGTQNLMVDMSINGSSYTTGYCRYSSGSTLVGYDYGGTDPLAWSGTTHNYSYESKRLNIKLAFTPSNIVARPALSLPAGVYGLSQNSTVTCGTPGATIHYTTNGADPTESDPVIASGASVPVNHSFTLKAAAWKASYTPSGVQTAVYTIRVSTPSLSPNGGAFNSQQTVFVYGSGTMHYTTNGIDPTVSDPVITNGSSVLVNHSLTLKVKGWNGVMDPSLVRSAVFSLAPSTPAFSPAPGTYTGQQNVTVTCATTGSAIHYTTNGNDPTESDPTVASGGAVVVDHSLTLKARAWKAGWDASVVASGTYTILTVTPVLSPAAGVYDSPQNVTISCATPGAAIHYTTNGTDPTESDPTIASGGSVLVDHSLMLKAAAWNAGMQPSLIASANYVIQATIFSGGSGTTTDPYHIASRDDLLLLAAAPNWYSVCFIMTADISLAPDTFTRAVIAPDTDSATTGFQGTAFTGVFDGDGYSITGLSINDGGAGKSFLGLFGQVGSGGLIKNLKVTNCSVIGSVQETDYFGAIAAWAGGTIQDCSSSGTVSGGYGVGGLVGRSNSCTLIRCWSSVTVTSLIGDAGGLVGHSTSGSAISQCYATGNATASNSGMCAGGLVSSNQGSISNSYATGAVSIGGPGFCGGLVGSNSGTVTKCYSTGPVSGGVYRGGLIGDGGTTTNSFWDTQTSGRATSAGGTGKTTAMMKTLSTYTAAGWDFVGETANGTADLWYISSGSYPALAFTSTAVMMPTFSPSGGVLMAEQNVVVTCATDGATIHYTINGADPAESDPVISSGGSVLVDRDMVLKAKAWKSGLSPSVVSSSAYIFPVATPLFTPGGGIYSAGQNVVVTCATVGATIHYTTSGIDPTESDPVVASGGSIQVPVVPLTLLKAKAIRAGWTASFITSAQYRSPGLGTIYVSTSGNDSWDGLTRGTAKRTIQAGIDIAASGGTVLVTSGTYSGDGNRDIDFRGKAIEVTSESGPATCIIDAGDSYSHRGFNFHSGETASSILSGFTITRGAVSGDSGKGGGIYCYTSSPVIRNCVITGNIVWGYPLYGQGGGVYCESSSATIVNCTIEGNSAYGGSGECYPSDAYGGGIYSVGGVVTLRDCKIANNRAIGGNGGGYAPNSACFGSGGGDAYGGGVYGGGYDAANCVIIGNEARAGARSSSFDPGLEPDLKDGYSYGGGVYGTSSVPTFRNCTISGNYVSSAGTHPPDVFSPVAKGWGVHGSATLVNCVLWGNSAYDVLGGATASFSCMEQTGVPGTGNIHTNPLFVNEAGGDYRLQAGSPCVDTGSNAAVPASVTTDLAGSPRIVDGNGDAVATVDMGVYERQPATSPAWDLNHDNGVDFRDYAFLAANWACRSRVIPQGTVTLDGDLADWAGSEWMPLDVAYWGAATDVVDAKFAVKWNQAAQKIYVAVEVDDSQHVRSDSFVSWDASDRLEMYCQGNPVGGTGWVGTYDVAQQYYVAPATDSNSWATWAFGEAISPDAGLEYATQVTGSKIVYEVALKAFDNYGGFNSTTTVAKTLAVGTEIGFDVIACTRHAAGFGMLSENELRYKSGDAGNFARYTLVDENMLQLPALPGDLDGNRIVDHNDIVVFALHWLEGK